jgi:ABC-type lipoprotein release transport system permease subunit
MVIMTAVVIGVWAMVFLGALMRGVSDQMVRNGIATLTGHVQVHRTGYRSDPVIDNSITEPAAVKDVLKEVLPPEARWSARVRVNSIANNARHSAGVTMVGIDPEQEASVSFIGDAVTEGRYLEEEDAHGILVGRAVVETFETRLGGKLVLMSQDRNNEIASRAFRIVGIYQAELEATEKQFAFVTKSAAQKMLQLGQAISEVAVLLPQHEDAPAVAASLRTALPSEDYEVHTWKQLLPLISAYLNLYDTFLFLWFLVVFIAMGFGIVNTTLMAVFERIREFGLLRALGMKAWGIVKEVLAESVMILILGMAIGTILALVSSWGLSTRGIDLSHLAAGMEYAGMSRVIYPALALRDVVMANLTVVVLGLIVSIYPAVKAARFTPVQALAHT